MSTRPNKSETEIRMGGRYSIRKPGHTAWATTSNLMVAHKLLRQANSAAGNGHQIIDNRNI